MTQATNLLARVLAGDVSPAELETIPPNEIPAAYGLAFEMIVEDALEYGTVDAERIIGKANGNEESLRGVFLELLDRAEEDPAKGLECFRPTDLWNAHLFVQLHRDKVRYCERLGGWHYFDGKRWAREACGEVERLAKGTVREMYEMAALDSNDTLRKERAKHATRSESVGKLAAILELAKTEEGIAVSPEAFDAQPWLFNVANGTLDLITGELRPHRPEDMLTNLSPAEWRGLESK